MFTLLFELLIGASWAIVAVLALMVKQGVLYISAYTVLREQGANVKGRVREEKQLARYSL